jgi:hypothetical protein
LRKDDGDGLRLGKIEGLSRVIIEVHRCEEAVRVIVNFEFMPARACGMKAIRWMPSGL